MLGPVLRFVRLLKVLFEKVVLRLNLMRSVLRKVVQLGAEGDKVNWPNVVRPEDVVDLLLSLRVHREAVVVVGEVAEKENKKSFKIKVHWQTSPTLKLTRYAKLLNGQRR